VRRRNRQIVADVTVVLLDGKSQVFAGKELAFGNEAAKAFPVVGYERAAFDSDLIEKFLTGYAVALAVFGMI
jgi:hypothetical protein